MTCKHGETGCVCTQCDLETIAEAHSKSSASPTCSIALPNITDDLIDQFYPWLIADDNDGGLNWNQAAVDFACVLKGECFRRTGKAATEAGE